MKAKQLITLQITEAGSLVTAALGPVAQNEDDHRHPGVDYSSGQGGNLNRHAQVL